MDLKDAFAPCYCHQHRVYRGLGMHTRRKENFAPEDDPPFGAIAFVTVLCS